MENKEKQSENSKKKKEIDSSISSSSSPSYSKKKLKRSNHSHSSESSSSSWSLDRHKNPKKYQKREKEEKNSEEFNKMDPLQKKRKRSSSSKKRNSNSEPKKSNDYKDKISIPGFDGPLITESLFKKLQHDSIPAEIVNQTYKEYKEKYEKKKFESFFIEHENDEWFREKYNPETFTLNFEQSKISCNKLYEIFKDQLEEYKNDLNLTYNSNINLKNIKYEKFVFTSKPQSNNHNNSPTADIKYKKIDDNFNFLPEANKNSKEEIKDFSQSPYFGFDPDKNTLFVHKVPKSLSRLQIHEIAQKTPGYLYISLSEPIKAQNYNRYCWMTFNSEENCNKSYDLLKDYKIDNEFKLSPVKSKSALEKIIRVSPSIYENRIDEDILNTKKIIKIFDEDKGLNTLDLFKFEQKEDNKDLNKNSPKDEIKTEKQEDNNLTKEEKIKQLDLQILYLRKVHGFCFYCFEGYEDERILSTKCDHIHLRFNFIGKRGEEIFDNIEKENEINLYDKCLTERVDEFIKKGKIEHYIEMYDINNDEALQKLRKKYAFENNTKVAQERYQCDFCGKLFKGVEYVINHIINKHMNIIKEEVDKKHSEKLKKKFFMNDSNKNYEKIKVISDMDEYFNYLNAMKKYQNYEISGRKYHSRDAPRDRDRDVRESKYTKSRNYYRENEDYDKKNSNMNPVSSGRKLISYEDL